MNRIFTTIFSVFTLILASTAAYPASSSEEIAKVRTELGKMFPVATNAEIVEAGVEGVYRIEVQGSYAFAFLKDDFILIGDLYNTAKKENVGDVAQANYLKGELKNYEDKMIVFGPDDAKYKITVFTDVTCYYCKKLHSEVQQLVDAGIQVRYLMWPRRGLGSDEYNKNLAVWCNADQQKAMTDAKADRAVPAATCENPINETFEFGRRAGVSGTPMILFDDGSRQPGYVPSPQLIARVKGGQGT
ncbi:MAG: DsbC family protein [Gammaproteobacteria bacterium]|nr:DsbC family protein [Gammaproteobacteria bacterium]